MSPILSMLLQDSPSTINEFQDPNQPSEEVMQQIKISSSSEGISVDASDVKKGTTLPKFMHSRGIHKDQEDENRGTVAMDKRHVLAKMHLRSEIVSIILPLLPRRLRSRSSHSKDPEVKKEFEGTTWIKAVPFPGIHKDEENEIRGIMERIEKNGDLCGETKDRYFNRLKLTGVDRGGDSIRVGPVLEVISVSISNISGSLRDSFGIYGDISVPDDKNNIFYIYKCESDDPEWVSPKYNHLFLNGCTIPPVVRGKVKFSLTNEDSGLQIFEGDRDVEKSSTEDDEGKSTLVFDGKDGYRASMVFNKIPYAVIARLEMYLCDKTVGQAGTFKVHGTIKVNNVVCFQKQSDNAREMVHGKLNCIGQSRLDFAVPVYTPVVVEIELFSGDLEVIADDTLELVHDCGLPTPPRRFEYPCKNKRYLFGVDLSWFLHDDYYGGIDGFWANDENVKWSSDVPPMAQIDPLPIEVTPDDLVEVFSVYIGGGDSAPLALCGTIVVRDGGGTDYIFLRNGECPDYILPDMSSSSDEQKLRIVSLAWPKRWVRLDDFYMHLKLKDERDNQVCRGSHCWCFDTDTRFDRRMCNVIRGDDGYFAVVHYSVFKNGRKAKVELKWEGDYSIVYGSVYAEYSSNYEYPSTYDKEYYRSIIFKRSKKECVEVKYLSEIPLSKSHVSAPSDCQGLIVHVKLWHRPIRGSFSRAIGGKHLFEAKGYATQLLGGHIWVKVDWV